MLAPAGRFLVPSAHNTYNTSAGWLRENAARTRYTHTYRTTRSFTLYFLLHLLVLVLYCYSPLLLLLVYVSLCWWRSDTFCPFDFLSSAQVFTVGDLCWCWGFAIRDWESVYSFRIQELRGRKSVVAPCRCPRSSLRD